MGRMRGFSVDGMKKEEWTSVEDRKLVAYITENGRCDWRSLPHRTEISCLKKRLARNGIDPMTHEPFLTVDSISSSTTTSSPSSSTGSAHLLNKLAAGLSSKKHKLDMIKTLIFSEQPREAIVKEKIMMISKEEEEVITEIDKKLSTASFDELQWDPIMSIDDF